MLRFFCTGDLGGSTRFGEVDAELANKIAAMLELPHQELTPLLLTLSREELLERFAG
ncbi:hypothetical protein MC7420_55 [Coleofasciculus chthonoplastes PCC 7420]|uniref:Uncharacterized protein n=1 Tax=Coleofasciculus chthonoplastes PCC 7420 TaxID=118168 RepID=B4W2Z8_9CYAN|nr:hypothetical protein [Coleofasciculus chthonoplastes]EDX71489.1 hypothetical protein MC7420_55 [Coleofasciculus chthonoplastes PCC 7420]